MLCVKQVIKTHPSLLPLPVHRLQSHAYVTKMVVTPVECTCNDCGGSCQTVTVTVNDS